MLVSDVMTTLPVTVGPDATTHEALVLLAEHGVTAVPVVDAAGRLSGMLSEADAIRERVPPDPRAHATPPGEPIPPPVLVADVMTPMPVTIQADTDLAVAVDLLTTAGIKSMPVVDGRRRLVGIVSRSDVVRVLARSDDAVRAEVEALLAATGHRDWTVEAHAGTVLVDGPQGAAEASLARAAAAAVPGVTAAVVESEEAGPSTAADGRTVATSLLVELACRAPSIHNTQPWHWRIDGLTLELFADQQRRLPLADPDGRNLIISCGAALHHLRVAARAHGLSPAVERLPEERRPSLLARVVLHPDERPTSAARDLAAIAARVTDRRRFTTWPVPDSRLVHLAEIGSREGAVVVPVLDSARRHLLEILVDRAYEEELSNELLQSEHRTWMQHSASDGVPAESIAVDNRTRFDDASAPVDHLERADLERSDGVLVLTTPTDDPIDLLRAGESLSALWLAATSEQLSVVPLSQVTELPEVRASLQREVLGVVFLPQLAVRIGWQEVSRSELPRTPRRPLRDVLAP